eukprot:830325-Alexandrium_andersonii.AAC.1
MVADMVESFIHDTRQKHNFSIILVQCVHKHTHRPQQEEGHPLAIGEAKEERPLPENDEVTTDGDEH